MEILDIINVKLLELLRRQKVLQMMFILDIMNSKKLVLLIERLDLDYIEYLIMIKSVKKK